MSTNVTVTLKLADPLFPCASVAEHVTVVAPTANTLPDTGEHTGVKGPSRLSFALAENETAFPDATAVDTEMSAGGVTTGGVVSTNVTVTVKLAEPVFPCASVAEHVTVVAPTANTLPDTGEHEAASDPSTRSVALTENDTAVPPADVVEADTSGGDNAGGVVSTTLTGNVTVPVLLCASVAVHVTVVEPSAKVEPEAGLQFTATAPSTASVAVGFV